MSGSTVNDRTLLRSLVLVSLWTLLGISLGWEAGILDEAAPAWAAEGSGSQTATDIYYKSAGVPVGPPAPTSGDQVYRRYGNLDNRILVWFVAQQHTYFGGFVLALPIFCVIIEFLGLVTRDRAAAARELARVLRPRAPGSPD